MTTVGSIYVSHEGPDEAPFTVRMTLKPGKAFAPRLVKQYCKAHNGKRATPLDPEAMRLSLAADGSDPVGDDEDVRFLFDSEEGVAFVVARPAPKPAPAPLKKGFLAPAAPAPAKPAPAPAKPARKPTKLKKGFFNTASSSPKKSAPAAPAKKKVDDETYAQTPSIQLMPWAAASAHASAGDRELRDKNVKVLSHRTADIDMKIDRWAESVQSTRREPTMPVVQPRPDRDD